MNLRQRIEMLALGAIWGSSFLFMRAAAPELGPIVLIAIRVLVGALFLTAVMVWRGELASLRGHTRDFAVVGTINSALPFSLFAFATLSLTAGFTSVLNATTPLFGALVAFLWFRERLPIANALGLFIGFAGVILLVWHKLVLVADGLAIAAGLAAALGYGIAAHYTKRRLAKVPPLTIATGTQIAASIVIFPFALATLPDRLPSLSSLGCALVLGIASTGVAYLLFFRLLAEIGAARAMTVTYLIPVFGMLWGCMFRGESITVTMILGCLIILVGTTLVTRAGPTPARAITSLLPSTCPTSPTRNAP